MIKKIIEFFDNKITPVIEIIAAAGFILILIHAFSLSCDRQPEQSRLIVAPDSCTYVKIDHNFYHSRNCPYCLRQVEEAETNFVKKFKTR